MVNGCKYLFSVLVLVEFFYLNFINYDFYFVIDLWCKWGKILNMWKLVFYFIVFVWKWIFEVMLDEYCSDLMMFMFKINVYDKWLFFGGGDRGVYISLCNVKV